jgi:NAD(P)-dependent dehydrogenase (short-subunit alcohol dehydrogenase family)
MTAAGKTAVVTGANRGIGLETVRQLAAEGCRVFLTARDDVTGKAEAERLGVDYHYLEVSRPRGAMVFAETLRRLERPVDILVNNAGISMHGFDDEVVRRTLEINFFGAINVTDGLLPLMPDGATIVMVSSGMGQLDAYDDAIRARFLDPALTREQLIALVNEFVAAVAVRRHEEAGWPSSAYRVSKAALNALTRVLARDLAPRRIRVNAVCPGWVKSRMGGASAPRSLEKGAQSVVWAALLEDDTTGGFFRDGKPFAW